jgi:hypothetical protein
MKWVRPLTVEAELSAPSEWRSGAMLLRLCVQAPDGQTLAHHTYLHHDWRTGELEVALEYTTRALLDAARKQAQGERANGRLYP